MRGEWQVAEPDGVPGPIVWLVELGLGETSEAGCRATLSGDEVARADRFPRAADRVSFVASHAALRLILAAALETAPLAVAFRFGANGKPALASDHGGLHFNLSHSGTLALVALSRTAPVGVDIEVVRPLPDLMRIATAHFEAGEIAALRACATADRLAAFMACWTRKEAVVKAMGVGLSSPLDRFAVSIPPRPAAVLHVGGDAGAGLAWSLEHLAPKDGYVGAVATPAPGLRFARHRLAPDWATRLP